MLREVEEEAAGLQGEPLQPIRLGAESSRDPPAGVRLRLRYQRAPGGFLRCSISAQATTSCFVIPEARVSELPGSPRRGPRKQIADKPLRAFPG
jgi:hypothetical protein